LGEKIERNKMGGACNMYGAKRGIYRVLVRKPEGKRPLAVCFPSPHLILCYKTNAFGIALYNINQQNAPK